MPVAGPAVAAAQARLQAAVGPLTASAVPPHLTVLYPHRPPPALGAPQRQALAACAAAHAPLPVALTAARDADGLLALHPAPLPALAALVAALRALTPDLLPYGGVFGPAPALHVTVDHGESLARAPAALRAALVASLRAALPLVQELATVDLWLRQDGAWTCDQRFPLGAP